MISPLFKMFGGGQINMGSAPFLQNGNIDFVGQTGNASKVVIDIGVYDGIETAEAVAKGFVVFAFEPINEHIDVIMAHFAAQGLSEHIRFINLTEVLISEFGGDLSEMERALTKERLLSQYPISTNPQTGFCYLFQAAAAQEFDKVVMTNGGAWTQLIPDGITNAGEGLPSTVVTVPVSRMVHHDVFWFKSDTQGYELTVLRGAVDLFRNHNVLSLTIEFWPYVIQRLYGDDGIEQLMTFLEQQLQIRVCFPSRTDEFGLLFDHELDTAEFVQRSIDIAEQREAQFFDDLTCF